MSYLEKYVLSQKDVVKIKPEKNRLFLVLKWIWGVLGFWVLLIPTIQAISASIEFRTTEYLITDSKVMEKYGFLATHTDEMKLNKIENITVTYTLFGKIFNYATMRIQGTNHNDIVFTCIKNAEELKKQINELIDSQQQN